LQVQAVTVVSADADKFFDKGARVSDAAVEGKHREFFKVDESIGC
jgi:hypothetical protein